MKYDIQSVQKQTRFLPLLAKLVRIYAVLSFAIAMILGAAMLFSDHWASVSVDEYGNRSDNNAFAAVSMMLGNIVHTAIWLIVASLLDSLRGAAVNSAKAASLTPA